MGSIEADGLLRLMNQQHQQNRGDIDDLKAGQITLTHSLTTLTGEISGATRVMKFIGWVLLALIAALGVWFTSLEVRGKMSEAKPPSVVSSQQPSPEDAGGYTGAR